MTRLRLALLGATALLGLTMAAQAQNNFPSAGGATVPGSVAHYLNPSSVAIPASAANPFPVTILSGVGVAVTVADGADVAQGTTTDAACATDNGTCTVEAVLKRIAQRITSSFTSIVLQAGSNIVGKVGIDQTTPGTTNGVTPLPVTAGGLSVYFVQPTASDNHANIKNGAGQVYKITVTNNSATVNYLRLYNAGTGFNGCNSATNLVYQVAIPASATVGGVSDSWDMGIAFATGISICVTSGYAQTDTTNATASAMSVNVGYK